MGTPQILITLLLSMTLGIELAQHGKPREGRHNFLCTLISVSMYALILYWGGFWS